MPRDQRRLTIRERLICRCLRVVAFVIGSVTVEGPMREFCFKLRDWLKDPSAGPPPTVPEPPKSRAGQ